MTTKEYMHGIIKGNSTDQLLPMTHKNNHGITLDAWQVEFANCGIDTEQKQYNHKIYSVDGLKTEKRMQLVIVKK